MRNLLRKNGTTILCVLSLIFILASCRKPQPGIVVPSSHTNTNQELPNTSSTLCGKDVIATLTNNLSASFGEVKINNDKTTLYINYTAPAGYLFQKTFVFAGKCNSIPQDSTFTPLKSAFPFQQSHTPFVNSYVYKVSLSSLDSCFCILAAAELVKLDGNGNIIETQSFWTGVTEGGVQPLNYCRQACSSECVIRPGDFRTQTQGGWGSTPQGNNPGTYLHKNFTGAFPNGLTVGCNSQYTIKFTTAQSITDFLPCGGSAAALSQNYINPNCFKNVFASQVIALSLSIGFDNYDKHFSASSTSLGSLVIGSGPLKGVSINDLLAEANKALGGCTSKYSISDLNAAISSINENFVDGTINKGFLTCP